MFCQKNNSIFPILAAIFAVYMSKMCLIWNSLTLVMGMTGVDRTNAKVTHMRKLLNALAAYYLRIYPPGDDIPPHTSLVT